MTSRAMLVSTGLLVFACLSGCECAQYRSCCPRPVCACESQSSNWISAPSPDALIEDATPIVPSEPSDPPPSPATTPKPLPIPAPDTEPKALPAPAAKVEREANTRPAPPLFVTP